jgi:hypothetical protein
LDISIFQIEREGRQERVWLKGIFIIARAPDFQNGESHRACGFAVSLVFLRTVSRPAHPGAPGRCCGRVSRPRCFTQVFNRVAVACNSLGRKSQVHKNRMIIAAKRRQATNGRRSPAVVLPPMFRSEWRSNKRAVTSTDAIKRLRCAFESSDLGWIHIAASRRSAVVDARTSWLL